MTEGSLRPAVSELVARLEAATEGSRELDDAVLTACGFVLTPAPEVFDTFWRDADGLVMTWERPTLSLDCALALAERVLRDDLRAIMLLSEIIDGVDHNSDLSISDLPRLLCIAILKTTEKDHD
jgi:hypothetical protein